MAKATTTTKRPAKKPAAKKPAAKAAAKTAPRPHINKKSDAKPTACDLSEALWLAKNQAGTYRVAMDGTGVYVKVVRLALINAIEEMISAKASLRAVIVQDGTVFTFRFTS